MADLFSLLQKPRDTSLPPDHKERERALDVEQSWIVEAPAGSGKTGLLIQRYLKLLAHPSVDQPEQVLAITFTVKATTEIRDRVVKELEAASKAEPLRQNSGFAQETRALAEAVLERDRLLGWQLLDHPHRLTMRTIDSVCAQIAHTLPVLSGGGGQSPVPDAGLLYREAARQTLMQLGGSDRELDEALRTVLLHRDGNLAECERLIADMLQWRDQWGELIPLGHELNDVYLETHILPRLESTLQQAVCSGLAELATAIPPDFLHALCATASSLADLEPYERHQSPIAACAGKTSLPSACVEDLEHWRALIHLLVTPSSKAWRKSFSKNHIYVEASKQQKQILKSLLEEIEHRDDLLRIIDRIHSLPPPTYPHEQWHVAKALFRILSHALAELQIVFARRGECDFTEPALLARAALAREGGPRDLSEALGIELRHLLVDEMQDTSTGQYELIELLTQGWDGRSQTVFLVGDPKQSIYLFRQARVERFIRTTQTKRLGDLPLESLQLTANFRSQSDLVESFNEDFDLLFPRTVSNTSPEEVAYVAAEPVNGPSQFHSPGIAWHTKLLSPPSDGQRKREQRRQSRREAWQVREIIQTWRAKPLPWTRTEPWKIAVLVRSRGHLLDIVAALKEQTIPFRAVDIEPLKDRQEVLDLLALTRALLHPADRVAWLAILHAPWCGLGLAELHLLAGADNDEWSERSLHDVIAERGDLLSEEGCARLQKVWPILDAARRQRAKLTISQWVERTWRSLGGDAALSPDELANTHRYLQLLDEVEDQSGTLDLSLLERRMEKLFAGSTPTPGAIDLITIHGAKGLEWDVVLVPGLEKRAQRNRSRLLTWSEINASSEESAQIMLAPIAGKGEGSKELNRWLNGIHNAREAAERKRLYYVACTRAREELHLFASLEAKPDAKLKPAFGTLLQTAWPIASQHFEAPAPASTGNILTMPKQLRLEDMFLGEIAAEADPESVLTPRKLYRLPLSFNPADRFHTGHPLPTGDSALPSQAEHFVRPEGSFEARALGNAVHAFLELLTKKFADGNTADTLLEEVTQWQPRIAAVLRADGLPRTSIERLTTEVRTALENTLRHPEGRWILEAHEDASSEFALTTWTTAKSSVRLDRIFRAGPAPLSPGSDHLWIVDYKTATHATAGLDKFLAKERAKYEPQMTLYAQAMRNSAPAEKLRTALYYPLLSRLMWWIP